MSSNASWAAFRDNLYQKIDWEVEYDTIGCEAAGESSNEWQPCYGVSLFGEDANPSAQYNLENGRYYDFRNGYTATFWDLLVALGKHSSWREAQQSLAKKYGVSVPKDSKDSRSFAKHLDWSDEKAEEYCKCKPPITVEGLKYIGAKQGLYQKQPCLVLDIQNQYGEVCGHSYVPINGKPFPSNKAKAISKKFNDGQGFIGRPAIESILNGNSEIIYWVEGHSDLMAAYSVWLGKPVFITNISGAAENLKEDQINLLRKCRTLAIIADNDDAGLAGGAKRRRQLREAGIQAVLLSPPDGAKDLREWLRKQKGS